MGQQHSGLYAIGLAVCLGHGSAAEGQETQLPSDAFGSRIGNETVGLYGEDQIRGFNLEDAGNYRLDGLYFMQAAAPNNTVVTGSETRIGVNALRFDFPAPSGVIDYQLRAVEAAPTGTLETGWRANAGPFIEHYFSAGADQGHFGAAGGLIVGPSERYPDGSNGQYYGIGAIPQWRGGERLRVRGVASLARWITDGEVAYLPAGAAVPPQITRGHYFGQDWSSFDALYTNLGAMLDWRPAPSWTIEAGAFVARANRRRADFNLLADLQGDGTANAITFITPQRNIRASSGELRASHEVTGARVQQRWVATLRLRDSLVLGKTATPIPIGAFNLFGATLQLPEPSLLPSERTHDRVRQATLGLGYRADLGKRLELNLGAEHTSYEKAAAQGSADPHSRTTGVWLYNASLLANAGPSLTAFATALRGLEEAGSAPSNALNRNAILAPTLARQRELGVKLLLNKQLSLIVSGFDLRRPTPALDPQGVFRVVGEARHRGLEVSLAGNLSSHLSVVAGALLMQPRLHGELVASGAVGAEPVGRSSRLGVLSLNYALPHRANWSLDFHATYKGPRQGNGANSFQTPGYTVFDLGARYRFRLGGHDAALRLRVLNAADRYGWFAAPSELLYYEPERAAEARLQVVW